MNSAIIALNAVATGQGAYASFGKSIFVVVTVLRFVVSGYNNSQSNKIKHDDQNWCLHAQ